MTLPQDGSGGRTAGADEGQRGLEDDGLGDLHRAEHQDGGGAVDGDVLDEDVRGAGADDALGDDIVLAVLIHHIRAYDPCDGWREQERDGADQDEDAASEDRDEHGGERDPRERHHHIQAPHQRLVDGLARGRRDRAEHRADDEGEERRPEPDRQGPARPVHEPAEDVPAQAVLPHPVVAGRMPGAVDLRLLVERVVRGEQGCEECHEHDDAYDADREPGEEGQPAQGLQPDAGPGEPLGQCLARRDHQAAPSGAD